MTKDEVWGAYVARNPKLGGTENVTMTAAGFKKFFDQTWKLAAESAPKKLSVFEEMFGREPR